MSSLLIMLVVILGTALWLGLAGSEGSPYNEDWIDQSQEDRESS